MSGVDLAKVHRQLGPVFKGHELDSREIALLSREGENVALLPEATIAIAQAVAECLVTELERVIGDVRLANGQLRHTDPDWQAVSHAVAFAALRRAWIATHAAFTAAKTEGV